MHASSTIVLGIFIPVMIGLLMVVGVFVLKRRGIIIFSFMKDENNRPERFKLINDLGEEEDEY